jgi:hypothetical protein
LLKTEEVSAFTHDNKQFVVIKTNKSFKVVEVKPVSVYVMRLTHRQVSKRPIFKVGISSTTTNRLTHIRCATKHSVEVLFEKTFKNRHEASEVEKFLHQILEKQKVPAKILKHYFNDCASGFGASEWFHICENKEDEIVLLKELEDFLESF